MPATTNLLVLPDIRLLDVLIQIQLLSRYFFKTIFMCFFCLKCHFRILVDSGWSLSLIEVDSGLTLLLV